MLRRAFGISGRGEGAEAQAACWQTFDAFTTFLAVGGAENNTSELSLKAREPSLTFLVALAVLANALQLRLWFGLLSTCERDCEE